MICFPRPFGLPPLAPGSIKAKRQANILLCRREGSATACKREGSARQRISRYDSKCRAHEAIIPSLLKASSKSTCAKEERTRSALERDRNAGTTRTESVQQDEKDFDTKLTSHAIDAAASGENYFTAMMTSEEIANEDNCNVCD